MYTLTDYKNDGELSFDLLKKYNEHPENEEVSTELRNVHLRMEKFAAKKFIGKYLKYNEYVFNVKGKLVDTITHLLYPSDTVQITLENKKYKVLSHKNNIAPYCNYGVTAGKYYIKTSDAFSVGNYYEEITKDEWNAAKAKLVSQDKADEINAALQILGNAAISYVYKKPSKEQKKAESTQNKLYKKYRKASQAYMNICNKRIEEMKTKITSNDFDVVLKNVQKDGYFGVCDNDLSYIFKPKTNKKKK